MIRALLDSDVVLSAFLRDEAQSTECMALMDALENGAFMGITTPVIMANVQYMLGRKWESKRNVPDRAKVTSAMRALLPLFTEMIPIDVGDFYASMDSEFTDLEDGLQHFAALRAANVEAILTCNGRHFKASRIEAFSPSKFLADRLGQ